MSSLLKHITPFQNKYAVLRHNQSTNDIINGILVTHNLHKADYDKICLTFNKKNNLEIGRAIYNYLATNTHYKIESDNRQTLRSPAAILHLGANRKVGLDCKSYALFTAGILDALNRRGKKIDWCYRFASYRLDDNQPHHVFVVINPGTKNEIWIDNVIKPFNHHKQYFYKLDKKTMALIAVAGIGGKNRRNRKNAVKGKIKKRLKKGGRLLLKFNPATVSARNSFLLMVKLNIFGLARKLAKVQSMKPTELYKFWNKIGGNVKNLEKAINVGKTKGNKHKRQAAAAGMGVVPAAIAAAIAAATPIIAKIGNLLKSCGIDTKKLSDVAKKVISKVADSKIDEFAEQQIHKEDSGADAGEFNSNDAAPEDNEGGNNNAPEDNEGGSDNAPEDNEDNEGSEGGEVVNGVYYPRLKNRFSAKNLNSKIKRFNSRLPLPNLKHRRFL